MAVDSNGLFARARKAAEDWNKSVGDESSAIENAMLIMNQINASETEKLEIPKNKPNAPEMLGMKKVMYKEPTASEIGEIITEDDNGFDEANWYNYDEKKWANGQTADGSLWVWIPRFAYKINGEESTPPIDIVFLNGTSDEYYDEKGNVQKAKRASDLKNGEVADTTKDYYVHPAFTDESNLTELGGTYKDYENGGWDEELKGIWVAKFEAGFASGNNDATPKYTDLTFSQPGAYIGGAEAKVGGKTDVDNTGSPRGARNWLQGVYGANNGTTNISYPVFMGTTYSMNYITQNDKFLLCKKISASGNPYNLNTEADSHLMKDSEWGAVAYLSKSKYGLGNTDIYINNISLDSNGAPRTEPDTPAKGVESVYAVTGLTGGTYDGSPITIKAGEGENAITKVNDLTGNTPAQVTTRDDVQEKIYRWDQKNGTGASTTGTIYGIYDLSGGLCEETAAYTNKGNDYGKSVIEESNGKATKYIMQYPYDADKDSISLKEASAANWEKNTRIFGDAIRETSSAGTGSTSWYGDSSKYVGFTFAYSCRGHEWNTGKNAGIIAFAHCEGVVNVYVGFRAVLVGV